MANVVAGQKFKKGEVVKRSDFSQFAACLLRIHLGRVFVAELAAPALAGEIHRKSIAGVKVFGCLKWDVRARDGQGNGGIKASAAFDRFKIALGISIEQRGCVAAPAQLYE